MRTQIRQQLLEMTDSMLEAAKTLDELYRKKEYAQFKELLGIVQEAALTVGNKIEETEGEGTAAVSQLENLCELVWGLYENVETENPQKRMKLMNKQLLQIRNSIKYDIPVTYEVVFLPYKASMWDSLESIWMAAKEAPDCNCRVIPIPYFDRKPDGTPRNWYDESGEFPGYVPITKYTEYHLETERPDIIFIHNPYDDQNTVTSIHPDYYSRKIREYTSLLVYVPYFVANNDSVNPLQCLTSGVLYAHKTILQSDKLRDVFIRGLREALDMSEERFRNSGLEDRYLALGSPKLDKMISGIYDADGIPEPWKRKIGSPKKKVILYNSTIVELLNYTEGVMKKLEDFIEIFPQRDDMVLLWRPHPLSISTIESVRPHYEKRYMDIVERFQTLPNVIYDNSQDSQRALLLADAYIGDETSSMLKSFGVTGKPILITDYNNTRMGTISCAVQEDILWMFHHKYNAVFKLHLQTKQIEFAGALEGAESKNYMFKNAVAYGQKIFFIPYFCDCILVVDTKNGNMERVVLEEKELNNQYIPILHGKKIYLFPILFSSRRFVIDAEDNTVEAAECPLSKELGYKNEEPVFVDGLLFKEHIFLVCDNKPFLAEYAPETDSWEVHRYKGTAAFYRIAADDENIWIMSNNPVMLLRWNKEEGFSVVSEDFAAYHILDGSSPAFSGLACIRDSVWFIPFQADHFIKIDRKTGKHAKVPVGTQELLGNGKEGGFFGGRCHDEDYEYLFSRESDKIVCIDKNGNRAVSMEFVPFMENQQKEIMESVMQASVNPVYRESYCSLKDFLDIVAQGKDIHIDKRKGFFRGNVNFADGTAGKEIWKHMKEELERRSF